MATRVPPALEALLPEALVHLGELAANLWWIWQPDAQRLFSELDPAAWEATNHNPVATLLAARSDRLQTAAADPAYLEAVSRAVARLNAYLTCTGSSWYAQRFPDDRKLIAYFCAEFGLHESLPIYSGGLGVDINLIGGLFMRAEWEYARFTSSVDTSINNVRAGLGYKF